MIPEATYMKFIFYVVTICCLFVCVLGALSTTFILYLIVSGKGIITQQLQSSDTNSYTPRQITHGPKADSYSEPAKSVAAEDTITPEQFADIPPVDFGRDEG